MVCLVIGFLFLLLDTALADYEYLKDSRRKTGLLLISVIGKEEERHFQLPPKGEKRRVKNGTNLTTSMSEQHTSLLRQKRL